MIAAQHRTNYAALLAFFTLIAGLFLVGCGSQRQEATSESAVLSTTTLTLPQLEAADLNERPLRVAATTSIIGDVVGQVGGDHIDLMTLMQPGQDPHGYQAAARDLTAVADADLIFVNGWGLEEGLARDLEGIAEGAPIVPISAGITPLELDDDEDHADEDTNDHAPHHVDPHVWFDIENVKRWTENAAQMLSERDPDHAAEYSDNAASYIAELDQLQAETLQQFGDIPADRRFLVTNHDSLSYLAHAYDLTILGTVLPAASTLAEPSAADFAGLVETMEAHNLCTIFTESTVSDALAQTVAAELSACDQVQVTPLYTGALGPPESGADSFVGMFRANVTAIVGGLQ